MPGFRASVAEKHKQKPVFIMTDSHYPTRLNLFSVQCIYCQTSKAQPEHKSDI